MERTESAVLWFTLFGILLLSLGSILYARSVLLDNAVSWELQLVFYGMIVIGLGILTSKILSKVNI